MYWLIYMYTKEVIIYTQVQLLMIRSIFIVNCYE